MIRALIGFHKGKYNNLGWENTTAGGSEEKSFYKNDHKYVVGIYYVDNSGDYIVMAEAENASGEKSLQDFEM
jgi:hypothetical protein